MEEYKHKAALRAIPKRNEQGVITNKYYPLCMGEDYISFDGLTMHPEWHGVGCKKCLSMKDENEK